MRHPGSTAFHGRHRSGVTVLELLLALTAIILVVTVALPWAESAMVSLRAAQAADTVAAAMTEARSLAVGRHRPVRLIIDDAGGSVDVEGGDFRRLSAGIRLSGPQPGPDGLGVILFRPDGSSDGGQVVVSTADIAWSLSIDPKTGNARRVYAGRR